MVKHPVRSTSWDLYWPNGMYHLFHHSFKLLSLSQLIAYFYVLDCLGVCKSTMKEVQGHQWKWCTFFSFPVVTNRFSVYVYVCGKNVKNVRICVSELVPGAFRSVYVCHINVCVFGKKRVCVLLENHSYWTWSSTNTPWGTTD